jgi:hypothetical protein
MISKINQLKDIMNELNSEVASIQPGGYKRVQGTEYKRSKAYAARNRKGELAYFGTEDAAKHHAEH